MLITLVTASNAVKVKVSPCSSPLIAQQTWNKLSTGQIQLNGTDFCLDLTHGSTANRNVLQLWKCEAGNKNQVWVVESGP
jgi:hypothetical protein